MKQDILIVGHKDSIIGFTSIGIKALFWTHTKDIEEQLHYNISNGTKIVFITEDIFQLLESLIGTYKESLYPIFIPIPSLEGSQGIGYKKVIQLATEALGQTSFDDH